MNTEEMIDEARRLLELAEVPYTIWTEEDIYNILDDIVIYKNNFNPNGFTSTEIVEIVSRVKDSRLWRELGTDTLDKQDELEHLIGGILMDYVEE